MRAPSHTAPKGTPTPVWLGLPEVWSVSAVSWQLVTREWPLQEHCCIQSVFTCWHRVNSPHSTALGKVRLWVTAHIWGWTCCPKEPLYRGPVTRLVPARRVSWKERQQLQKDLGEENRTYLHRGHSFPGGQELPQECRGAPLNHSLG